ncbi:hypothetical protein, partial [Candidatus Methanarcanum hacksteinii]|uniref:hypothetical protein n=1 Tax=Candidatus Methanarcanum hacksteinii TaxID=2911857 RepID=UPI0037DD8A4B
QKRGWYLAVKFDETIAGNGYEADLSNNTIVKEDVSIDGKFVFRYNGTDPITIIVKDSLGLRTQYTIDIEDVELETYSAYIEKKGGVANALATQGISVPQETEFGDATILVISNEKVGRELKAVSTNNGYEFKEVYYLSPPEADMSGLWVGYMSLVAKEETASKAVAGPYNVVIDDKNIDTVIKTGIYTVGSGYESDADMAKSVISDFGFEDNTAIGQTFYYVYQVYGTYGQVKASMIRNADEGNIILPAYDNFEIKVDNIGSKHIFYYSFLDNQLKENLAPIGGPYVMTLTLNAYSVFADIEVNADTVAVFQTNTDVDDYIGSDYSISQS